VKKIIIPIIFIFILSSFGYAQTVPYNGVAFYNFSSVIDLWNGYNGTNNGASSTGLYYPSFNTSGNSGLTSYDFTTNDYVSIPKSYFEFEMDKNWSYSSWVRFDNSLDAKETLITDQEVTGDKRGFSFAKWDGVYSGELFFNLQQSQPAGKRIQVLTTTDNISLNNWHHIVTTYDGSMSASGVTIYIDGLSQATTTLADTIDTAVSSTENWSIGYDAAGSQRAMEGQLDHIKIYNTTLNETEILNLYNYGNIIGNVTIPKDFTINHITPANNTINNTNLNVGYSITDTTGDDFVCILFVNDSNVNLVLYPAVNTTLYLNYTFPLDGIYKYYVRCQDVNTTTLRYTGNYTYTYDTTQPFISAITPNQDNTTVFNYSNRNLNLNVSLTDDNLYKGNLTIYNSTGSVMYNNYTGDLTGNNSWLWNSTIDMSLWETGLYTMFIEATDSHTAKYWDGVDNYNLDNDNKRLSFDMDDGNIIDITLIDSNKLEEFNYLSTTKTQDRYSFEFYLKDELPQNTYFVFNLKSGKKLDYIANSDYIGHFITGKNWIDFEGVNGDFEFYKINDFEYNIKITLIEKTKELIFNSLGGLNENNKTVTFNILENLTIQVNDTNTGLLLNNFTVTYNSGLYTANGTNITLSVYANQSASIIVSAIGYIPYINSTFVGYQPKNLTVNLTSGGTILNFYDEFTNALITSQNVTVDMVGNVSGRFSTSIGSVTISGLPAGSYSAVYFSDGYISREYPIILNATGLQTINLYLCNSSICENIIGNVFDTVGSGLPGYQVQIFRLIDGTYNLVEIATSNFEGQVGFAGERFTPSYKFLVVKNGTVFKETNETEIYSTTLDFFISEFEDLITKYIKSGNLRYILQYNNVLNRFEFSYLDPSYSVTEVCLRVTAQTNYTEAILYNETCLNAFSGIININVAVAEGTVYIAKIYTSFSPEQYIDSLSKRFEDVLSDEKTGLWVTLLVVLIVGFVGLWFPSIAVILIAIALWITRVLGLHAFGYTVLTGITVACVIFSYIFAKVR